MRIVIVGPTASGKSALALAVAERLGAPLLCVDSMTVYRGMDIGTAKPSPSDQARVPHHLLDLVDPNEEMTVTLFADHARAALAGVEATNAVAVLAGGTGLYVDTVVNGLRPPGQWPEIRAELDLRAAAEGSDALHAELVVLDPLAASRMEPTNTRRVVRALEVCLGSGRPFSSFGPGLQSSRDTARPGEAADLMVGLRRSRAELALRIEARFSAMLGDGLLDECVALRDRYGATLSATARQALGYRELWAHLDAADSSDGGNGLEAAVARAVVRTRQFAVRQERWFRRDPRIVWLDVDPSTDFRRIADRVVAAWSHQMPLVPVSP